MTQWEIESISIKNLGPFVKKQTLSFLAPSKEKNQLFDDLNSLYLNKIKYKFNNIIGIFGPNSSGKTQLLEAIKNYLKYNNLNPEIHNDALIYFYKFINKAGMPAEIEVKYISNEGRFIHKINFDVPKNKTFNLNDIPLLTNYFFEEIIFENNKNIQKLIFENNDKDQKKYYRYKNSFMEMFNFQLNISDNDKDQKIDFKHFDKLKMFFEIVSKTILMTDPWTIEINQNWDSKNPGAALNELINLAINYSLLEAGIKNLTNLTDEDTKLLDVKLLDVKDFITNIAQICDPSIDEIDFDFTLNPFNKKFQVTNAFVIYQDSDYMHPIDSLSSGTLTLMLTILRMYCDVKINNHALFIFDELGKSWHSQLLTNFLVFYATTPIFKNTKIIFTSHHPEAANVLRTDATWFINKDHYLNSAYSFTSIDGISMKRNIFSKNYTDPISDIFSTTPSITDFENIEPFLEVHGQ